jgi:hypothetical protein
MGSVLVSSAVQMHITYQNEKTWTMARTGCLGHRRCLINRIERLRLDSLLHGGTSAWHS